MLFEGRSYDSIQDDAEKALDRATEDKLVQVSNCYHCSLLADKELDESFVEMNYQNTNSNLYLDSYHRLISHLGQLALQGTQIFELYRQAGQFLVRELGLVSCEFWEVLVDQDTLNLVEYTTAMEVLTCPQAGSARHSLKQILHQSQSQSDLLTGLIGQQYRLLNLEPRKYGLIIPGTVCPAGIVVLTSPSLQPIGPKEMNLLQDVTSILATAMERKRSEMLLLTQTSVLQSIASGSTLQQTLLFLCQLLEQQNPGAYCSILFLNAERQQLESGIAPSLPQAYAEALNGLVIGDCAGSCGTAAFRGEPVFVYDIQTDPLWVPFRDLASSYGIRSCWSMPFLSQTGEVLGTFALSFAIPCRPASSHLQIMETATHLASIATERFRATQKLTRLALYDDLTGLVNRSFFTDHLSIRLKYQRESVANEQVARINSFALLFLDLDRFKLVNDSFGHIAGDQLLVAFSQRIIPCLRAGDIFARLGGDEFAIFLDDAEDIDDIKAFANRLLESLKHSIQLDSQEIFVTTSIGIVHVEGQYQNPKELLRDADTAMYEAKLKYQGGGYVFFDESMHAIACHRMQLELELRRDIEALSQGSQSPFFLTYQPIVTLPTGELMGFEVLLRWSRASVGTVLPSDFIAVLEETGLIMPLGDWVLETACQQLQEWRSTYPQAHHLKISINVSGQQFLQPSLVLKVESLLAKYQLPPSSLRLEVTESVLIETAAAVSESFHALKSLGVLISLDDFGTGYSSLRYLKDLPVDHLKIDRSFIIELEQGENSIVQAVIDLSHSLGMQAIAEGVENVTQAKQLIDLGCDFCQGYLYAKPLLTQSATELVATPGPNGTMQCLGEALSHLD